MWNKDIDYNDEVKYIADHNSKANVKKLTVLKLSDDFSLTMQLN